MLIAQLVVIHVAIQIPDVSIVVGVVTLTLPCGAIGSSLWEEVELDWVFLEVGGSSGTLGGHQVSAILHGYDITVSQMQMEIVCF